MDLEKLATERGISIPTFYKRLREMTQEDILIKDKGKGKKSSYRLNPKIVPKIVTELEILKLEIEAHVAKEIREKAKESDEKEVLDLQSRWLAALNLWALLEHIDTGDREKPFIRIAEFYDEQLLLKQQPYRQKIRAVTPFLTDAELIRASDAYTPLGNNPEYKIEIKRWKQALRELFPEQIKAIEGLYAKVRAGKSDFKIMASEEGHK